MPLRLLLQNEVSWEPRSRSFHIIHTALPAWCVSQQRAVLTNVLDVQQALPGHSNEAVPSCRPAPSFTDEGTKVHLGHDLLKVVKTWTRIHTSRFMV